MSTQPLNIISRYGEDDISLWTVNVEFEDYKRVAGNAVQLKVELSRYLHRGSPPHTRGKVARPHHEPKVVGITPAHAGKSYRAFYAALIGGDHPRTRGEKFDSIIMLIQEVGSPPHTRGKVINFRNLFVNVRITPAHAGKSLWGLYLPCSERDHPRTRGEKSWILSCSNLMTGSPPHARGKVPHFAY